MPAFSRRQIIRLLSLATSGAVLAGFVAWLPPRSELSAGAFPAELAGLYRIESLAADGAGDTARETEAFLRIYPNGRLRLEGLVYRTVEGRVAATTIVEPGLARWHVERSTFGVPELCITRRSGAKCARLVREVGTGDLVWGGPALTGAVTHQHLVRLSLGAVAPGNRAT